jgi:hypothetical protein
VLAVVVLAATRVDAAMAAPVPCKAAGGGHLNCQFYVAGNGRSGGSPVQAASAAVVGYLHQGTNWVVCQRTGGRVASGPYFNNKWAWTLADNLRWGWVNAVYARGGDNDSGFGGGVPACGAAQGLPPGGGTASPAPIPPAGPLLPAPADEGWKTCRSPWMRAARVHDEPQGPKVSFRPTKRARYAARGVPRAYRNIWRDLQRCVSFPALSASQSDSMYKQMVCHTFWGVAHLGGPTWDFESWRPDVSSWKALRVREHSCNWDRSAWTDTTKCVELRFNPSTCLSVHGGGLDVGSVRLGVRLNSRQSSDGHWQLWVPSQPENTTERLVNNRSFLGKNVWGQTLKVDRSFRAGQRLCVKWWRNDKPGSGRWSDRGKACVTISR